MRINLFWRILPGHIIIVLVFALPFWQRHQAEVHASQAAQVAQTKLDSTPSITPLIVAGAPSRVLIPSLTIDLPIVDGAYDSQLASWPVAEHMANYAKNTAQPNNNHDKTLIYGHATKDVFGKTQNLAVGDEAYIYTANGHVLKYSYQGSQVVSPTDTQIFSALGGKPGLALMTCDGEWSQNRRIMYFELEAAK